MGTRVRGLNNPLLYSYQYDQLNRLVGMDAWNRTGAAWSALSPLDDFKERIAYDPNGNILQYLRNGNHSFAGKPLAMDSLGYKYIAGSNKLDHIADAVAPTTPAPYDDIQGQSTGNYKYDSIGQLTSDDAAGISNISWTVYGKIASITKGGDTTIYYTYDPGGNRISKSLVHGTDTTTTWYVRDAQGNVLSVYTYGDPSIHGRDLTQTELHIYGSSRLGIWRRNVDVELAPPVTTTAMPLLGSGDSITFTRGHKLFELTNHLGNVLATISDKRYGMVTASGDSNIAYFIPDLVSANDYYPFGMLQPYRSYAKSGNGYRYGFNGKENDNEVKGTGDQIDYGMRVYDPRIGKFLSVDPLTKNYPELTPYQFASNTPIQATDLDGKEGWELNSELARQKRDATNLKPLLSRSREEDVLMKDVYGRGVMGRRSVVEKIVGATWAEHFVEVADNLKTLGGSIGYIAGGERGAQIGAAGENILFSFAGIPDQNTFLSKPKNASNEADPAYTERVSSPARITSAPKGTANPVVKAAVALGNRVHYDQLNGGPAGSVGLPSELQALYPQTQFNFTLRGAKGADVEVVGGLHPSQYPKSTWASGNNYGDFKPGNASGNKTFKSDVKSGKVSTNTQQLNYNPSTGALQ